MLVKFSCLIYTYLVLTARFPYPNDKRNAESTSSLISTTCSCCWSARYSSSATSTSSSSTVTTAVFSIVISPWCVILLFVLSHSDMMLSSHWLKECSNIVCMLRCIAPFITARYYHLHSGNVNTVIVKDKAVL